MSEDDHLMHEGQHDFLSEDRVNHEEDRRKDQRRKAVDRRDMIRFEVKKDDRRTGKDRRKDNADWGGQPV
jgi:hypothetical protein